MEEVREREKQRAKDQFRTILNWLDVKDYIQEDLVDKLADRCHEGTGDWLVQHAKVKSWIGNSPQQCGLWINGIPGSGE